MQALFPDTPAPLPIDLEYDIWSMRSHSSFPGDSVVKNPPVSAGDMGLTSQSGKSHGEGNVNSLQYFCLGNPMDKGTWWTI